MSKIPPLPSGSTHLWEYPLRPKKPATRWARPETLVRAGTVRAFLAANPAYAERVKLTDDGARVVIALDDADAYAALAAFAKGTTAP